MNNMRNIVLFIIAIAIVIFIIIKMNHREDNANTAPVNPASAVSVDPIEHASLILGWDGSAVYADPVGADLYTGKPVRTSYCSRTGMPTISTRPRSRPLLSPNTVIMAPQAVADAMPEELKSNVRVMKNGDKADVLGFSVEAVPMYNLRRRLQAFIRRERATAMS
ncbi:MAG: hypothetical protein WDN09_01560 [bacterium]